MREKLGHRTRGAKTQQNSPGAWHYSPLQEGASSHRGTTEGGGGNGWEPRRRLRRRTNTREGAGWQRPGRWRRREEPGKRQEGPRAGGAQLDPGHSHDDGPRWRSRWRRSPRRRRRAEERGRRGGSGGPRRSRWRRRPRRRWGSRWPRWSRSDRGLRRSRGDEGAWWSQRDEAQPEECSPKVQDGRGQTKAEPEGRGSPAEPVDRWATAERREARSHGGAGGSTGRDGVRASEAESRETPTTATLEDGSPAELAPHRWWAEGEQRGCQTTAVEEAEVGGRVGIFEERALEGALEAWALECTFEERVLEDRSPLRAGQGDQRRRRAGRDQRKWRREERGQFDLQISLPVYQILFHIQQPQMYRQLTLSRGAGGGAPLRAHTVRGILPRGRLYCRLSHLDWRHQRLWLRSDPQHCRSVRRWLVGRGGLRLSVSGGLGHALCAAGRWWAGHWVGSGSGEIILLGDCEERSISRQSPLHEGGEFRSRTIFGWQRSARGVQACVIEWAERVVRIAGGVS